MPDQIYFSWVGDPTATPVYLSTTGNVHDGTSLVTTGDILTDSDIVTNLADVLPLIVGGIYEVTALGIPTGAHFIYSGGTSVALVDINGQDLFATLTGSATLAIAGTFGPSAGLVSGVQGLETLTPGLRYAITGPGIPDGDTFTAPAPGETVIALDVPATLTGTDIPLAISGPISTPVPFDPAVHTQNDVPIFGLELNHNENERPLLHIVIPNPGEGLLSPDRQQWAWLSWDPGDRGSVIPLCLARVMAVPESIDREAVRLLLMCEPPDDGLQKQKIAAALWHLPNVDPVFLSQNDVNAPDPNVVLEARSEDWHTDRVTLEVTTSDVLEGEDGTLVIDAASLDPLASRAFYDSLSVNYAQPPNGIVLVELTFAHTQNGNGTIDATRQLIGAFQDQRSAPYGYPTFSSLTGDALFQSLPKPKGNIGGGWTVSADTDVKPLTFAPEHHFTPMWSDYGFIPTRQTAQPYIYRVHYQQRQVVLPGTIQTNFFSVLWAVHADFPVWTYTAKKFGLEYSASRKCTERVLITVQADLQISRPGAAPERLSLSSDQVADAVDFDGSVPIGDSRRSSYAQTDRGFQSIQHGVLRARSSLRRKSRVVEYECSVPWTRELAETLSCRMNARLIAPRLGFFGGEATGKIISYTFSFDPQSGARSVKLHVGCAIGNGGTVEASPGSDGYVEAGYVEEGYYARDGAQTALGPDIWIESPLDTPLSNDGVNLFDPDPSEIVAFTVRNGLNKQCTAASVEAGVGFSPADPIGVVSKIPTELDIEVLSMTGAFHTQFSLLSSPLRIPKGVDLMARAA